MPTQLGQTIVVPGSSIFEFKSALNGLSMSIVNMQHCEHRSAVLQHA